MILMHNVKLPWSIVFLTSLMAQRVKHLSAMQETRVWSLGREDPLEKEMAIHSSIIAWKIPWTEEPGWLQSMGSQQLSDFAIGSFLLDTLINHTCDTNYVLTINNAEKIMLIYNENTQREFNRVRVHHNTYKYFTLTLFLISKVWVLDFHRWRSYLVSLLF